MTYPRYPLYKDSGVEWLGEVPAHWELRRARFLFRLMQRPVRDDDEVVTAFRDGTVTLRKNRRIEGFTNSEKEIGYQGVRVGDLVIHAMDAFAGAVGVSDSDGKSSPVYSVCMPVSDGISAPFYARLIRHMALTGFIASLSKGIRERSTDFRYREFADLFLPLPPADEQAQINDFLERETARIDALITKQERLIALLREKRQALISHAVTKGLNPDAPMKASGVEWLGVLPARWDRRKFNHCVRIAEGQVDPRDPAYSDCPLIAPNHIQSGTGRLLAIETASEQGAESGKYWCDKGDIIYSKIRPALRKACIAPSDCLCSADMYPLKAWNGLDSRFLIWFLLSDAFSSFAVMESERVAMPKVNRESLAESYIPLPPAEEQQRIADFLDRETAKVDILVGKAQQAIDLLTEHRTSLISAVVTGKIDVRAAVLAEATP